MAPSRPKKIALSPLILPPSAQKLLSGKKLKGKLGGLASILFAYSSGDIDHLLALIPDRIKNKKRANAYSLWLLVTFSRTYSERMSVFRTILWIPVAKHLKHLKT